MAMFHGVSIRAGEGCACDAVISIENVRFLSDDAPMLPLNECSDPARCRCTYVHYDDRRTEPRRETDIGLPARRIENDRRVGQGRRITD